MDRHGIARSTRPRTEQQRQQELDKIQRYRDLEDQFRLHARQESYGPETLHVTSKLLRQNPEYYTAWNVRRRCLISGSLSRSSAGSWPSKASPSSSVIDTRTSSSAASLPSSSTETPPAPASLTAGRNGITHDDDEYATEPLSAQYLDTIKSELTFTVPLLMEFPKCYWLWNYRSWILAQAIGLLPVHLARKVWEEELGLVSKMLSRDRRNFHAWEYRRAVVAELEGPALAGKSMVEAEFDYTTAMIHKDLSNFSAWHNRSQLIPRLLNERQADDQDRRQFLEEELELLRNGLNVGPEDQSLWFYHQYLVSNIVDEDGPSTIAPRLTTEQRAAYIAQEIAETKDLMEDYDDIKMTLEALIEDTVALSRLQDQPLGSSGTNEIAGWLRKLRSMDPKRVGRWDDLERNLASMEA